MTTDLGRLLRRVRKARKYKLRQVAVAVNVTPQYIWNLENGKAGKNMRPAFAVALAEFLQIPIQTFFTAAGFCLDDDLTSRKFLEILKLTRNKGRASRIQHAMDAILEHADLIHSEAEGIPYLRSLCEKLKEFAKELEAAISAG